MPIHLRKLSVAALVFYAATVAYSGDPAIVESGSGQVSDETKTKLKTLLELRHTEYKNHVDSETITFQNGRPSKPIIMELSDSDLNWLLDTGGGLLEREQIPWPEIDVINRSLRHCQSDNRIAAFVESQLSISVSEPIPVERGVALVSAISILAEQATSKAEQLLVECLILPELGTHRTILPQVDQVELSPELVHRVSNLANYSLLVCTEIPRQLPLLESASQLLDDGSPLLKELTITEEKVKKLAAGDPLWFGESE